MTSLTLAATGHRPDKLGGYNTTTLLRLQSIATKALTAAVHTHDIYRVISGMALGWDLAIAQAALDIGLPLIAAIPCPQQPAKWSPDLILKWKQIKDQAKEVHIISPTYTPECMQRRNIWMINNADVVLALFNGKQKGGTWNAVQFAIQTEKPIINVWDQFKAEVL